MDGGISAQARSELLRVVRERYRRANRHDKSGVPHRGVEFRVHGRGLPAAGRGLHGLTVQQVVFEDVPQSRFVMKTRPAALSHVAEGVVGGPDDRHARFGRGVGGPGHRRAKRFPPEGVVDDGRGGLSGDGCDLLNIFRADWIGITPRPLAPEEDFPQSILGGIPPRSRNTTLRADSHRAPPGSPP